MFKRLKCDFEIIASGNILRGFPDKTESFTWHLIMEEKFCLIHRQPDYYFFLKASDAPVFIMSVVF